MKTRMNHLLQRVLAGLVLVFLSSALLNAQFENPSSTSPQTLEEVRTGTNIEYSLAGTHVADEEYRWVVRGGTITSGGTVSSTGDSSIVEWSANAHTIEVDWTADLSSAPVGSGAGEIIVQKRNAGGCPSVIQVLPITQWNNASATMVDADLAICSGESAGTQVSINLTGAPDASANGFVVTYNITATGLTDGGGNSLDVTGATTSSNGSTASISLPASIVNTTLASAEFRITLTSMHDDFDGNGTLGDTDFVVTVHPTPETGDIMSGESLARR